MTASLTQALIWLACQGPLERCNTAVNPHLNYLQGELTELYSSGKLDHFGLYMYVPTPPAASALHSLTPRF